MVDLSKIKTYILHYTKLTGRRQYMEGIVEQLNLDATWITDFDQEVMVDDLLDEYHRPSVEDWNTKVGALWDINAHGHRPLKPSEISLTAKHVDALKRISEDDAPFGLILEDDVLLASNPEEGLHFTHVLNHYFKDTPEDWDVIFPGNGYGIGLDHNKQKSVPGQKVYLANHPASRCTEAMFVKKEAAKKLYDAMKPFTLVCDWEYGWQFYNLGLKVYWYEPAIITQASHALDLGTIQGIPEFFRSTLR